MKPIKHPPQLVSRLLRAEGEKKYHSVIKQKQEKQKQKKDGNQKQPKNHFNKNLSQLSAFVEKFNKFPGRYDNPKLYRWMAALIFKNKRRMLPQNHIDNLNSIGFIWEIKEFKWYKRAQEVKKLLEEKKQIPHYSQDKKLYNWVKMQLRLLSENKLVGNKKIIVWEIKALIGEPAKKSIPDPKIKLSAKDENWKRKLKELVEYRNQNCKNWPRARSANEKERKLGIWCEQLRSCYRKKELEDTLIRDLANIGFNFEGKVDNWKTRFAELEAYVVLHQKRPTSIHHLYQWAALQYRNFNRLSSEQQELLNSIGFIELFPATPVEKKMSPEDSWNVEV
jgi:hypothetical protein